MTVPRFRCEILAGMPTDVDTVRSYYEAINRGDLDTVFEWFRPEIEFHLAGLFPDLERVYHGHGGVREFLEKFSEPWEELKVEPTEIIDVDGRVLALLRFHARGRDGITVNLPLAHLWTLIEGQAVRMQAYADQGVAKEAAGLPREP
jgi:uncharacterized protein